MNDELLILLPIILMVGLVAAYAVQISRAGGTSQWVEQRKEQAEAQGGMPKVLMRTVVTVLVVLLMMALIQFLGQ